MAVYGTFETVAEIGRTRATVVLKARPADGGWDLGFKDLESDVCYAIKAMRIRSAKDAGDDESRRFLLRVRDQKRVAALEGNSHWAPILEAGEQRGEVYYVTRVYPSSVAGMIQGRKELDGHTLWSVVTGVLRGMMEIQRTLRRPHGNLKPGNILLTQMENVEAGDVVLTDPAVESDATIAGEVEDLYNLGEIIYEMVLGEKFAGGQGWPVKLSARWQALGATGSGWLELCNRLLSPRAAEQWLRVDDIMEEVATLRPRGARRRLRTRRRRKLVPAIVLLVIAGLVGGEWIRYRWLWRDLCASYEQWVGPVAARLEREVPPAMADDAHVREHLLDLFNRARAGDIELNPQKLAGTDQPLGALGERAPLSIENVWKTERAHARVAKVESQFSASRWPAFKDVAQKRELYRAAGLTRLAEHAAQLVDDASRPRAQRERWVDALARLIEGQRLLVRLDTARAAAAQRVSRLTARLDAASEVRGRIDTFIALVRMAGQTDASSSTALAVEALVRRLEDAEQVAGRFETMLPDLVDASRRQRAYEVRGWTGPAKHLAALIESVKPAGDAEFARVQQQLSRAREQWGFIEVQWQQIDRRRNILDSSGDRILLSYRQYILDAGLGQQADLTALAKRVEDLNDNSHWRAAEMKVDEPEWANFDVIAFAQRSVAHRDFVGRTVATDADLKKWLAEVEGHGTLLASATIKPDNTGVSVVPKTQPATSPALVSAQTRPVAPLTRPAAIASAQTKPVAPEIRPTTVASAQTRPLAPAIQRTAIAGNQTRPVARETPPGAIGSAQTKPVAPETRPTAVVVTRPVVDPEKIRLETEIANFIIECREVGINATQRDIKQAWLAAGTRWGEAVLKEPRKYTEARAARQRLRGRLLQLDGTWRAVSTPLGLDSTDAPWAAELSQKLDVEAAPRITRRALELIEIAVSDDAQYETKLAAFRDGDEQRRGQAMALAADVRRVAQHLAAGHMPSEKSAQGEALATALNATRASELATAAGVAGVLEPVLGPVATVEKLQAPDELRKAAGSAMPLGLRLMAWFKLPATATRKTLDADMALAQSLLNAARDANMPEARAEALKTRLESGIRARWLHWMENATDAQEIDAAIALRERISGADRETLSARSMFNLALHELRQAMPRDAGDGSVRTRIAPQLAKVQAAAGKLDSAAAPQVKPLLDAIAAMDKPPTVDPATLGPMSEAARKQGGRIQWSVKSDENGAVIIYRGTMDQDAFNLVFRRVETSGSAPASYVLTTEVPVGLLDDVLTGSGKWAEVRGKRFLPAYEPARGDPRPGPRAWEWPRVGRSPGFMRALVWLSQDAFPPGADHYPDTIGSEFNRTVIRDATGQPSAILNPTRRQPMQYVSAPGAQYLAALVGCRLPTVAEWQSAYKSSASQAVNLRDRTWRLQLEHLLRPPVSGKVRPDAGMFVPSGEKPGNATWKNGDGSEADDGVLWFTPVPADPPSRFIDLAGNVGEFVTDDAGKVSVVGASALSPPERGIERAWPLAAEQTGAAFADVGFRLAFSVPAPSLEGLKVAVGKAVYVIK